MNFTKAYFKLSSNSKIYKSVLRTTSYTYIITHLESEKLQERSKLIFDTVCKYAVKSLSKVYLNQVFLKINRELDLNYMNLQVIFNSLSYGHWLAVVFNRLSLLNNMQFYNLLLQLGYVFPNQSQYLKSRY